jgi:hypothetical protein
LWSGVKSGMNWVKQIQHPRRRLIAGFWRRGCAGPRPAERRLGIGVRLPANFFPLVEQFDFRA